MCVGTKLAAPQAFEERKFLPAVQAPHDVFIVPLCPMLKGTLSSFHAVKHLCNVFEAATLWIVKYKTLGVGRSAVRRRGEISQLSL
jgi:hypothetical protein